MLPKNLRLHIFIWFWIIVSFGIISLFLILRASGYVINFKAKTIEKTGLIVLSSDPKGALLYVNGKFKEKTPCKLEYLKPGLYHLKIEKEGHQPWEKTEKVEAGRYIKEIAILFLKEPKITDSTVSEINNISSKNPINLSEKILNILPKEAQDVSFNQNKEILLYRTDYEIWFYFPNRQNGDEFKIIARFSIPIKKIAFYPDFRHILFISNGQLRIIEIDGTNDTKLLDINTEDFWVLSDGKEILYKDGDKIKKAKVR